MMSSAIKDALPTMFALARDHSEQSRLELSDMLANIFLESDGSLSLREEEMVNELIDQLLVNCTPALATQLVEKFVDVAHIPYRIARNLAQGNIDVARPVLLSSPSLTDDDLIYIVAEKSRDHACVIASRAQISEAVADALVTTGDVQIMKAVAENLGAKLTQHAIDIVTSAAFYSIELRKPLLYRPEINAEKALKLYWWVDQDLRRYTIKRFGISSGQIDQALTSTLSVFLERHVHDHASDEVMMQTADWLEARQALTPQVLQQVLRLGYFRLFNILLARASNLSLSLVDTIILETGGRGLASICRSIGIDKPGFVSLFLLSRGGRSGAQTIHLRELSQALAAFDRMTVQGAKDLLKSWDQNPNYVSEERQKPA